MSPVKRGYGLWKDFFFPDEKESSNKLKSVCSSTLGGGHAIRRCDSTKHPPPHHTHTHPPPRTWTPTSSGQWSCCNMEAQAHCSAKKKATVPQPTAPEPPPAVFHATLPVGISLHSFWILRTAQWQGALFSFRHFF